MTPFCLCLTLPKLVWVFNLDSMSDVSPLASSSRPPRSRRPRSTATPSPPPPIASTFAPVPARSAPANSFTARVNFISDSKFLSNLTSSNPIAVSLSIPNLNGSPVSPVERGRRPLPPPPLTRSAPSSTSAVARPASVLATSYGGPHGRSLPRRRRCRRRPERKPPS